MRKIEILIQIFEKYVILKIIVGKKAIVDAAVYNAAGNNNRTGEEYDEQNGEAM